MLDNSNESNFTAITINNITTFSETVGVMVCTGNVNHVIHPCG